MKLTSLKFLKKGGYFLVIVLLFFVAVLFFFKFSFLNSNYHTTLKNRLNKMVFRQIYFDRFCVVKNRGDFLENSSFYKSWVFYIKGYVDVEFHLDDFVFEGNNLIYLPKKNIAGKKPLPFSFTVNVSSSDFYDVYETKLYPLFSEENAEKFSSAVSMVLGGVTAYFGAKIGDSVGSSVCLLIPELNKYSSVCGLLGSAIVGGGAGSTVYFLSKGRIEAFFKDIYIVGNVTVKDKDFFFEKAKEMVVMDIMRDKYFMESLKESLELYLRNFYSVQGVKIEKIIID